MSAGLLGLLGFVLYWFGAALKAGPKSEQDAINKDERFR